MKIISGRSALRPYKINFVIFVPFVVGFTRNALTAVNVFSDFYKSYSL